MNIFILTTEMILFFLHLILFRYNFDTVDIIIKINFNLFYYFNITTKKFN